MWFKGASSGLFFTLHLYFFLLQGKFGSYVVSFRIQEAKTDRIILM